MAFVDSYNQRHSGIKFVAPHEAIVAKPLTPDGIVLTSINKHASGIHFAGHDPSVADVNRKWSIAIRHLGKTRPIQLPMSGLPDQQQRRHLLLQLPIQIWQRRFCSSNG